jgi:hypothetical protein
LLLHSKRTAGPKHSQLLLMNVLLAEMQSYETCTNHVIRFYVLAVDAAALRHCTSMLLGLCAATSSMQLPAAV